MGGRDRVRREKLFDHRLKYLRDICKAVSNSHQQHARLEVHIKKEAPLLPQHHYNTCTIRRGDSSRAGEGQPSLASTAKSLDEAVAVQKPLGGLACTPPEGEGSHTERPLASLSRPP